MCANVFSIGERISPEYRIRDVVLSVYLMARPMELRCCVFNKVYLGNHWRDILNCSYKWLCVSNSYRCIVRKLRVRFALTRVIKCVKCRKNVRYE